MQSARRRIRDMGTLAGILYQGNYNAQRTARLLVLGFELADHSLGLVVEGGDDLVGVLFRVVKSQAADCEIEHFMTVPRPGSG